MFDYLNVWFADVYNPTKHLAKDEQPIFKGKVVFNQKKKEEEKKEIKRKL
jgi:hypothetical protein